MGATMGKKKLNAALKRSIAAFLDKYYLEPEADEGLAPGKLQASAVAFREQAAPASSEAPRSGGVFGGLFGRRAARSERKEREASSAADAIDKCVAEEAVCPGEEAFDLAEEAGRVDDEAFGAVEAQEAPTIFGAVEAQEAPAIFGAVEAQRAPAVPGAVEAQRGATILDAPEPMLAAPAAGGERAPRVSGDLATWLDSIDESFSTTLLALIDRKGLADTDVYKRAHMSRQLFSRIRSDASYRPAKKTVLALSIAMELTLDEMRDLLARAGFALSRSSKRDVIVEYFVTNGIYDLFVINEALYEFDQPLI